MKKSLFLAALLIGCEAQKQDQSSSTDAKAEPVAENADFKALKAELATLSKKVEAIEAKGTATGTATTATGGADVELLKKQVTQLQKDVVQLKKTGAAAAGNPAAEQEAQKMLQEIQGLLKANDTTAAKAKLAEMEAKYKTTKMWRRASRMKAELDVFGKPAPTSVGDMEWYIGDSSKMDLSKGTTMLVFWEVWCPHCKREVPNLQKTYDTLSGQGLKMVGLTKLSRNKSKKDAMDFITEKNVSYPMAKEDGTLSQHFNVSGIPAAAVVKDGVIVWRGHPARLTEDQLKGWLN